MNNVVNEHQSQVFMLSPREREYLKGKFKPEKKDYERRLKCNIRGKAEKGWECLQDFALIVDHYLSEEKLRKELCKIFSSNDNSKIRTIGDLYHSLWKHIKILDKGVKFANLENILNEKTLLEINAEERRKLWRFWKLSYGFDNLSLTEKRELYGPCKKLIQSVQKKKARTLLIE